MEKNFLIKDSVLMVSKIENGYSLTFAAHTGTTFYFSNSLEEYLGELCIGGKVEMLNIMNQLSMHDICIIDFNAVWFKTKEEAFEKLPIIKEIIQNTIVLKNLSE